MKTSNGIGFAGQNRFANGSTLVIVLWIAFGLVSLTIYFGYSMSFELRAADNRVCGDAAEQAIEGAARYLTSVLSNQPTNGYLPDPTTYLCEAVPVGEARFWLIGRATNDVVTPDQVTFGLIDEASRVNLNTARSNLLVFLPGMTLDLTQAILDWRDTNGGSGAFQTFYTMFHPGYQNKSAPFESIDELRLVYGADMDGLVGEDLNRNGLLDPNENDANKNGVVDPGLLDYVTIWSREPNTYSNGTARVSLRNVNANGPLATLLQDTFDQARASRVLSQLGLLNSGGPGRPGGGRPGGGNVVTTYTYTSPLQFYRQSGLSPEEFAQIADALTTTNGPYIEGRININTASAAVLSCLPGLVDNPDLAQTLITYRNQNPDKLTSVAWIVEALGQNNASVLDTLGTTDCITTRSYQFTADVAAVGPYGRGYRRVKFVFDTSDGTPKIVYRQDLTHLGWALGKEVRQQLLAKTTS